MRLLLPLSVCLLLAVPSTTAVGVSDTKVRAAEDELDKVLDQTGILDMYVGTSGSCTRKATVEDVKSLYGEADPTTGNPTECVAPQCIGLPPNPYISTDHCIQMVEDLIEVEWTLHPSS